MLSNVLNINWYSSMSAYIAVFASNQYDKYDFIQFFILNRNGPIYSLEGELLGDISDLKYHPVSNNIGSAGHISS